MSAHSALETKGDSPTEEHSNATPTQYPTKRRLIFILICLVLGTFLVAIDTTIISVAVPKISTDFRALNDVGWYGSAYLMTLTAFQPTMSKIYGIFSPKGSYMASIAIFEGLSWSLWSICFSTCPRTLAHNEVVSGYVVFGRSHRLIRVIEASEEHFLVVGFTSWWMVNLFCGHNIGSLHSQVGTLVRPCSL